jgi:hypothetical protein
MTSCKKNFDKISYNSSCTFNFRLNLEFARKKREAQSILAPLAFSFDKKAERCGWGGGGRGFVRIDFYHVEAEVKFRPCRGQL